MLKTILAASCWILAISSLSALAQSSTSFSPAQQYQAIKSTMQSFYDRGLVPSNIRKPSPVPDKFNRPGEYDVSNCGEATQYLGWFQDHPSGDEMLQALTDLALRMVVWTNDMRKLQVPQEIWLPVLEKYEAANLQRGRLAGEEGDIQTYNQLAAELNGRRARAGRTLPKFVSLGGCGAGEMEVNFSLQPADGQLFLIPVFLYKLCEAQQLNPSDFKSCDRWREVFSGNVSYVSGDYIYLARWADGVERCGSLGINAFKAKQFSTIQITKLRSPKCSPAW